MDSAGRAAFNELFSAQKYDKVVSAVNDPYEWKTEFRICETPVFLTDEWTQMAIDACDSIITQIQTPEFEAHAKTAIPAGEEVPNPAPHPSFLQIDFAIAEENGRLVPKLIELQGFASMFCYQSELDTAYRTAGLVPDGWTQYFSGHNRESFLAALKKLIVGNCMIENVVLLEIEPSKQRTKIDFQCTERLLGIAPVCISEVWQEGTTLMYLREGKPTPIRRIYNRVIFDDLKSKNLPLKFHPTDDIEVEWIAHPNWFHKLSKHTLPFLKHEAIPESWFVSDLSEIPVDLDNFVLKPLYSFAGAGVNVNPTKEDILSAPDPAATLLQRKVKYAAFLETPSGRTKGEVRLMYLWDDKPVLASTLVRLTRGLLSSVSKNTQDTWIGATTGYHRDSIG